MTIKDGFNFGLGLSLSIAVVTVITAMTESVIAKKPKTDEVNNEDE